MKRILFVDDEQRILDGLRRMLHDQRHHWEMVFVGCGQAALAELEKNPFDVVVSDMRMPGMDGAALLTEVKRLYPNIVRIVLSGHTETQAALRVVPVAHQFLSKPCDADRVRSTVDRACGLDALLQDEQIRRIVGDVDSLPSLPEIYRELTAELARPDPSLQAAARIVERDPSVAARVLQVVNSAFFGLPQHMTALNRAVTYLGTSMLQSVLLSIGAFDGFEPLARQARFSLRELQDHSLATASLAKKLIGDQGLADDAFAAGMLHDLGSLVIACKLPEQRRAALEHAERERIPIHRAERETLGVSHAEVGAYLLSLWGLPGAVVEAVAHHHEPRRVPQRGFDLLAALYTADRLACTAHHEAMSEEHAIEPIDEAYLAELGVADKLPAWRAMAAETQPLAKAL